MEGLPNGLGFVHEGVLLRDGHAMHYVLSRYDFVVGCRQLEHLVREPLLRSLIPLQSDYLLIVLEELLQHFGPPPNVVNVGRMLRLPVVQKRQRL